MSYTELKSKYVRVRKPRKCVGCSITYPVSTAMLSRAYTFEGQFHSDYLCDKCSNVVHFVLSASELMDGFVEGSLKEYWETDEWDDMNDLEDASNWHPGYPGNYGG